MMVRLDAKNAKMAELIAQFTVLNSSGSGGKSEANQQKRDQKRKEPTKAEKKPELLQ